VYSRADLASGDIIFSATGVTDGNMVSGVKIADDGKISTETIVICSATKALHKIKTITMAKN
jgi:fructose-1,6-bisphosphatase II / sedoheptulose-1,7-bisphosphatase